MGPSPSAEPGLGLSLQGEALGHREAQPWSKQSSHSSADGQQRDANNLELLTHVLVTASPFADVSFQKMTWA